MSYLGLFFYVDIVYNTIGGFVDRYKEIERSIIKKYRKKIWSKFIRAVQTYNLIEENDRIMVCISGGKGSFLLAKCIEELMRHGKFYFEAKYVVMDPGYSDKHRQNIVEMAKILNLNIELFTSDIFRSVDNMQVDSPCYMCARMRRGALYNKAKELGCNKIALGHHFNDVIETTLLNIFYGSEVKTMLPKLHSDNFPGLELIRPLYLVCEEDIIAWMQSNNLKFINCACKFTEDINKNSGKREEVKMLIKNMKKINPNVDVNIFKALDNINLEAVIGYKKGKIKYSFLDDYDKK